MGEERTREVVNRVDRDSSESAEDRGRCNRFTGGRSGDKK